MKINHLNVIIYLNYILYTFQFFIFIFPRNLNTFHTEIINFIVKILSDYKANICDGRFLRSFKLRILYDIFQVLNLKFPQIGSNLRSINVSGNWRHWPHWPHFIAAVSKTISSFSLNTAGAPGRFICFPLNLLCKLPYEILYNLLAAKIYILPLTILINASFILPLL